MANNYQSTRLDALNNIGEDGSSFDKNLIGAEAACGEFIKRVVNNINDKGLVDTGKITDITVERIDDRNLTINGVNYILYLDEGIRGAESESKAPSSPYKMKHIPFNENLVGWVKRKITSEDKEARQIAYAIAVDRYKNGYEAQNIFNKEINQLVDEAADGVADVTINNFLNNI